MLTLLECPDPHCGATAELVDRSVLESTDGPVEHVKVQCVRGHHFFMPSAGLPLERAGRGQPPHREPVTGRPDGVSFRG